MQTRSRLGVMGITAFLISLILPNVSAESTKREQQQIENAGIQASYKLDIATEEAKKGEIGKVIYQLHHAFLYSKYTKQDITKKVEEIILITVENYLQNSEELYTSGNRKKIQTDLDNLSRFSKSNELNLETTIKQIERCWYNVVTGKVDIKSDNKSQPIQDIKTQTTSESVEQLNTQVQTQYTQPSETTITQQEQKELSKQKLKNIYFIVESKSIGEIVKLKLSHDQFTTGIERLTIEQASVINKGTTLEYLGKDTGGMTKTNEDFGYKTGLWPGDKVIIKDVIKEAKPNSGKTPTKSQ